MAISNPPPAALYKEIIMRNPKKVGSLGPRYTLHPSTLKPGDLQPVCGFILRVCTDVSEVLGVEQVLVFLGSVRETP